MAIAIIVEDGTGSDPAANSYVALTDLRDYATQRNKPLPMADDDCAVLLIQAMDYVEAQRDRYKGVKASQYRNSQLFPAYAGTGADYLAGNPNLTAAESAQDQPLQWPRAGVFIDNAILPSTTIPRELKAGQMAQALLVYDQQQNPANYEVRGPVIEETAKVDVITETTRYAAPSASPGRARPIQDFPDPDVVMAVLYKRGGMSAQVTRA